MKKLFIALFIAASLVMMFGVVGVSAEEQVTEVTVDSVITVDIEPDTLSFGNHLPGGPYAMPNSIKFNASGSNVDVAVEVTDVTPGLFDVNLDVSPLSQNTWENINAFDDVMECILNGDVCEYSLLALDSRLTIPQGTSAGLKTGTITYLFTEAP